MDKQKLLELILEQLEEDHSILLQAATAAHSAATHEENIPDSKYETLSVEASYIAQGQANRAQEIRLAVESFRNLEPASCPPDGPIRLGALVLLADEEGQRRRLFLGPAAGGMKLNLNAEEVMIITPDSPLGRTMLGKQVGDIFEFTSANHQREYEILTTC